MKSYEKQKHITPRFNSMKYILTIHVNKNKYEYNNNKKKQTNVFL